MSLSRKFYERDTQAVAQSLIGKILKSNSKQGITAGRIVEAEAYLAQNDSACHAAKHRTARTEIMFGKAGMAYVYPIHAKFCFNVVTETAGPGCAVLIRALEPMEGLDLMRFRRGTDEVGRLTTGPACTCQALGINRSHNGADVTSPITVWIDEDSVEIPDSRILNTIRIGVTSSKTLKLRYVAGGNPFVSGPAYLRR